VSKNTIARGGGFVLFALEGALFEGRMLIPGLTENSITQKI